MGKCVRLYESVGQIGGESCLAKGSTGGISMKQIRVVGKNCEVKITSWPSNFVSSGPQEPYEPTIIWPLPGTVTLSEVSSRLMKAFISNVYASDGRESLFSNSDSCKETNFGIQKLEPPQNHRLGFLLGRVLLPVR